MHEHVSIPAGRVRLEGEMVVPELARGIVVFARGSGSRTSQRAALVAKWLNDDANAATLLVDLRGTDERGGAPEEDVGVLAERLMAVRDWLAYEARSRALRVGYCGANTGAAAALLAAANQPNVAAIVSRGGRPDLAGKQALARVEAPTLLIVPGLDEDAIDRNTEAQRHMKCESSLELIPGATHLSEAHGTLIEVAKRASAWFKRLL